MGEVIDLNVDTKLDIEPEKVLLGAVEEDLSQVVVIGWTKDEELYVASSGAYAPDILYLLLMAQKSVTDTQE